MSRTVKITKYKKADGNTYYMYKINIGYDPITGKYKNTTKRGFKTEKEAKLSLARVQLQIDKGEYGKESLETFNDIYESWKKEYINTVQESTYVKTIGIFKNHIIPEFGTTRIDKINLTQCQQAVNNWADKIKGYKKIINYCELVFNHAIKLQVIKQSPLQHVSKPIIKQDTHLKQENFYDKDELQLFFQQLELDPSDKIKTFFRILAFTGMRKGEALALTWEDIDLENGTININKALTRGINELIIQSPKTRGSNRIIDIDNNTLQILQNWLVTQKEQLIVLGIQRQEKGQLVFQNGENKHIQPSSTRKWLNNIRQGTELKEITTHGFRHTHASLLFEAGASIKQVQNRLGHSDIQTTMNVYTHVTKHAKQDTINKFVNYIDF